MLSWIYKLSHNLFLQLRLFNIWDKIFNETFRSHYWNLFDVTYKLSSHRAKSQASSNKICWTKNKNSIVLWIFRQVLLIISFHRFMHKLKSYCTKITSSQVFCVMFKYIIYMNSIFANHTFSTTQLLLSDHVQLTKIQLLLRENSSFNLHLQRLIDSVMETIRNEFNGGSLGRKVFRSISSLFAHSPCFYRFYSPINYFINN